MAHADTRPQVRHVAGERERRLETGWAIKHGLIGGLVAGIVFAMFEMLVALVLSGNFWGPLTMIAGLPLQTPPPQIPLGTAIVVGAITHMALSMMYGVVVALIVANVGALRASGTATVLFATAVGFLLWPLNFYLVGPALNAPWFAAAADQLWQGFVAHTFLYGTVLGIYLAAQRPQAEATA